MHYTNHKNYTAPGTLLRLIFILANKIMSNVLFVYSSWWVERFVTMLWHKRSCCCHELQVLKKRIILDEREGRNLRNLFMRANLCSQLIESSGNWTNLRAVLVQNVVMKRKERPRLTTSRSQRFWLADFLCMGISALVARNFCCEEEPREVWKSQWLGIVKNLSWWWHGKVWNKNLCAFLCNVTLWFWKK